MPTVRDVAKLPIQVTLGMQDWYLLIGWTGAYIRHDSQTAITRILTSVGKQVSDSYSPPAQG